MPQIYTSQIGANTGRSNSPLYRSSAGGAAFGGNVAQATQALGAATQGAANVVADINSRERDKKRREEEANKVAMFDTTDKQLALRNEVGPDGDGYHEKVREMYLNEVDEYTASIEDDTVRSNVRTRLLNRLPSVSSSAAQYQSGLDAQYSSDQSNQALNALQNRISSDPSNYDQYIEDGENIIAASTGVNAYLKSDMQNTWRQNGAKRRFEGMLRTAKTKTDIDRIAEELISADTGKDWAAEFLPSDYTSMVNALGSRRKQFVTAAEANARSLLSSFEERQNNETTLLLPDNELTSAQEAIKEVEDPELRRRMARIMRDQDIIRQERGLPAADLRAQINKTNGNPNIAYPNLPPVVSGAINEASDTFGISASYLGAVTTREYGQFYKKPKSTVKPEYNPNIIGSKTLSSEIPTDVMNAIGSAGERVGAALNIIDTKGRGLGGATISTSGMGTEAKVKLVQALVDAGFTGFEEYDEGIHVSMQTQVPSNFGGQDGAFWGGWTNLSPAVSEVLKSRGFQAGASSSAIERKDPVQTEDGIDFGKGTQILDAAGAPTSSALGVMQFTKGTFLNLMKDPNVSGAVGVDVSNMSDDEILALRADPNVSIKAGAALALQNKKHMESTLGRTVSDAELYMAHFLGAPKALGLVVANKSMPEQSAVKLFPEAAKANKPVFYDGNRQKTVGEVYADISSYFTTSPTQVTYDDNQIRKRMLERKEQELKSDPIAHATSVGSHTVSSLDEGGFRARGSQAKAIADYYNIPTEDMKPFTKDEAQYLGKRFSEAGTDESMQILAEITSMGSEMSKAGFSQIAKYDPVAGYAGTLYAGGNVGVASDILVGRKRLQENPNIVTQLAQKDTDLALSFVDATSGSLLNVPPETRQSIQDAAFAHYIQSLSKQGELKWRPKDYAKSVQAVMGGTEAAPAIDRVNSQATVLPRGVTADEVETAIERMGIDDYAAMSMTGKPPRYGDGALIDPDDIKTEVNMRYIGGNSYTLALDDGSYLVTDEITPDGRPVPYVFQPDVKKLRMIANRPLVARR